MLCCCAAGFLLQSGPSRKKKRAAKAVYFDDETERKADATRLTGIFEDGEENADGHPIVPDMPERSSKLRGTKRSGNPTPNCDEMRVVRVTRLAVRPLSRQQALAGRARSSARIPTEVILRVNKKGRHTVHPTDTLRSR